ncbi:MAG TPA: magnesium/cobalt transporter CorA [Usitatibacteraceae bacterium]|nr:magnesium/cobalt transporter CorA [Usitatibacteraceae bacterium]
MLNVFILNNRRLNQLQVDTLDDLKNSDPIWIDLVSPSDEERSWIRELYALELPSLEDMHDIESSARFYEGDLGELHLRSDFLLEINEDDSRNVPVAFTLKDNTLLSLHLEDLPVFRLVRMRARTRPGYIEDAREVLLDLYATDVEYSADALESVYAELERISASVLTEKMTDTEAGKVLARIAKEEDLNGRIRRNLMDTRRAVSFLMRQKLLEADQMEEARQIMRDIESLDGHTAFLFDKINFLMDATVGFININQNKVIKIFSVASVAMLPPTLIASIYGMNFKGWFPELSWDYGYPFALALMVVSVGVPFAYFKRKGWLD